MIVADAGGSPNPDRPESGPDHDTSWGAKAAAAAPVHRATGAGLSTPCAAPGAAAQPDVAAASQPAAQRAPAWVPAAVARVTAEFLECTARRCCILGRLRCRR